MLKTVNKNHEFSPTEIDSETETDMGPENFEFFDQERRVRVIDRFGIIMQIFALRAKTRTAQIQIELAWLKYAKSLIQRGGTPTFGRLGTIFNGDLMNQEVVQVEVTSSKGTKTSTVGGPGETALEMEKQNIKAKEGNLRREL